MCFIEFQYQYPRVTLFQLEEMPKEEAKRAWLEFFDMHTKYAIWLKNHNPKLRRFIAWLFRDDNRKFIDNGMCPQCGSQWDFTHNRCVSQCDRYERM